MYIQTLEKINQQFKQVNSLTSLNFEEVIKKLKLEGETKKAAYLEKLLDNLNSEMNGVDQTLEKIALFFDKKTKV
ncbi:hypothetical protein LGFR6_23380 [Lactococcus garvieae]